MLIALALGAGTAGVGTVMAVEPLRWAPAPDRVALREVVPQIIEPAPAERGGSGRGETGGAGGPGGQPATTTTTSAPAETTTTSEPPPPPPETTTTTTTTTRTSRKAPVDGSAAQQVLAIANDERGGAGCPALALDSRLNTASQGHSSDMSDQDYFSHTSLDGRSFVDRAKAAGYPKPGAENIAKGQRTAADVMRAWMDSPGHRANILDCGLKTMGLGLDTDGNYWTQMFGR